MQSLFYPYNYPARDAGMSQNMGSMAGSGANQAGGKEEDIDYDQLMSMFPSDTQASLAMSGANLFNPADIGFSHMNDRDAVSFLGGLMQLIPQMQQQRQQQPSYMNRYVMSLMGG